MAAIFVAMLLLVISISFLNNETSVYSDESVQYWVSDSTWSVNGGWK